MTRKWLLLSGLLAFMACSRGDDDAAGADARRSVDARPPSGGPDGGGGGADSGPLPDARASDAPVGTSVAIQEVQDGTVAAGTVVTADKVFVTAVHTATGSGAVTLYVQEPDGSTVGGHTYPESAAIAVFLTSAQAAAQTIPSVGDCVDVTGEVDEFNMLTELKDPSLTAASGCGAAPAPFVIGTTPTFADIATDTDLVTAGDQPGALAERYEGVLLELRDVTAIAAPDAMYHEAPLAKSDEPTGPIIKMDDFLFDAAPAANHAYHSVTGIYSQFVNYKIQPRSAADLVDD